MKLRAILFLPFALLGWAYFTSRCTLGRHLWEEADCSAEGFRRRRCAWCAINQHHDGTKWRNTV